MIRLKGQRELARYRCGLLRRLRAVQWRVEMNALAAARHRDWLMTDVAQDVSDQQGNPRTSRQLYAGTRIKIKNEPVRVLRLAIGTEPPLRNVDLRAASCASQVSVARSLITG